MYYKATIYFILLRAACQ